MVKPAADDKVHEFYCTSVSGLEEIVIDDLMTQLPGGSGFRSEKTGRHGRVFFHYERSPRRLLELNSVTNSFALLLEFRGVTSGRPGLVSLCEKIAQMNMVAARKLLAVCDPEAALDGYQLQASLRGRHRFSKDDLRRAVSSVLEKKHSLQPGSGSGGGGMRFHLQVADRRATLGLQLTSNRSPGSLEREGVARPFLYCIGRLLDLGAEATVVVSACGPDAHLHLSPSAPLNMAIGCHHERRQAQPDSPPSSEAADQQVPTHAIRTVGLSTDLPFATSRVDCIVTNEAGAPRAATKGSLSECARILKPEGVAVVITASPAEFVQQIMQGELPFAIGASLSAVVAGRKYVLFVLERLDLQSISGV
jgi:hypothetical protein